ncbi:MAG: rod shape-determining protein MreC [Planctomycetes bacterium]|nr:rod shape-determining protein MreC [Planctomycetota bacterium]
MAPFHSVVTRLIGLVVADSNPTSDPDDLANQDGQRESARLRHQVATQQARILMLEEENAVLHGYRASGLSGGRLILARVIGRDSLAWRHSILLDEGLSRGIRPGQKVITSHFVDVGRSGGVDVGMSVLAGEALLGEVVEASSRAARVRLLGDVESRMAVVIARATDDDAEVLDVLFWMTGSQEGRMIIHDVDHKYLDDGSIRVGDLVLTDGRRDSLPISVAVGTIVQKDQQHQNRLLYNLVVEPAVSPESVQQAYVVNMTE